VADIDAVLRSLSTLQDKRALNDEGDGRKLKSALLEQLRAISGSDLQLPAETERAIDMVNYLVDSVQEDEALSVAVRNMIDKLEMTLGREAVRNESMLRSEAELQPALQILNQLEDVDGGGITTEAGLNATGHQVSTILAQLAKEWEHNSSAFKEAVEKLQPLVERQRKVYARNAERVVSSCEGRSRLQRARQVVLRRLVELLEGRRVPPSFVDIINPHWRNLLVNTGLRQGTRSVEWKQQLQAILRVVVRLDPDTRNQYVPPTEDGSGEVMIRCIVKGLDNIGAKAPAHAMEQLYLAIQGEVPDEGYLRVETYSLANLFGWRDIARSQEPMPPVSDGKERRRWLENLRRARAMEAGTNVKFTTSDGEAKVCPLAWVDTLAEHFVFVNRRGQLDREMGLGELTQGLVDGSARVSTNMSPHCSSG